VPELEAIYDAPMAELVPDLRKAIGVWVASPTVPLITLALSTLPVTVWATLRWPNVLLFYLPVALVTAGFYGTQRIWYLRRFRGNDLASGELLSLTWSFSGRFITLGLMVAFPWFLLGIVETLTIDLTSAGAWWRTISLITYVVYFLAIDFLLTFATPMLAFKTRSASQALDLGIRMIRQTWPRAALYVLVPPLALQLLIYRPLGLFRLSWLAIAIEAAVAALINLLFKGAVAAFYLREVPAIGDDGAAHLAHPTVMATDGAGSIEAQ
jgi:hypothetical protein